MREVLAVLPTQLLILCPVPVLLEPQVPNVLELCQ